MIFSRQTPDFCWICGSTEQLTGEHKIKKTDLKRHPVVEPKIRKVDSGREQKIQGLNSKLLKFENSICERCNNQTTQKADRSYDAFRCEDSDTVRTTLEELAGAQNPAVEREVIFEHRIELARYFGKHLGCALDYQKFPVPRRLSRFVGGRSDTNCISLSTRVAPFWFQDEFGNIGPLNGLGGALLRLHAGPFYLPFAYQSAYMTDGVQFIVKMRLSMAESLEIRLFYQQKVGSLRTSFDNEDAKHRGLPYDE